MSQKLTDEMIEQWLPITISDLKTFKHPVTDSSIKSSLYHRVIRELYDEQNFLHHEKEDVRVGCYIKGYVQDVWSYLSDAYDLIHARTFPEHPQTGEQR